MTCIRPLVEGAWDAQAGEVEGIAQQILNALPEAQVNSDQSRPALSADGRGMTETGATPPASDAPRSAPKGHSGDDAGSESAQDGPGNPSDQERGSPDADDLADDQETPGGPSSGDDGQAPDD